MEALAACQQSSVSLLSMVQAVWVKLLHYYLGENDVCFGNVVSGRTLSEPDLERLVAPCFNTLPVRVNFDFGKSNSELVQHLHRFNLKSLPFQLTPLRRIQAKTQKEGGRIFDTLFILQQPGQALDTSIWSLEEDSGDMDIPLVCEVSQDAAENNMALRIHYHHSLLGEKEAKIIAASFDFAFASCVHFPQLPARDTMGFPSKLLSNNNLEYSAFEPPNGSLLHSSFEHNAAVRPDSAALEFQHDNGQKIVLTFKELNAKANQVAHALMDRHVQPDDIVPVCMGKIPQFYTSILGILKAGAAFAPFHPDLPEARKQYMLSETKPTVLLCVDSSSLSWCGDVPTLDVNSLEEYPTNNPVLRNLAPTNLAYCLYTSGSTGLPKAVGMEHRSPIQTVESSRSLIPWDHDSRLLQYAAITFDMCYYDCFLAWSFGFCLCAASQDAMLNNVVEVINSVKATLLDLTPSVAAGFTKAEVPTVQYLYCIGEAMKPEIVNGWEGSCVNSYGPTEAAFCCTIFPVSKNVKTAVIGKPFPTTSFSVFPKQGDRALPIFGVGELYIGGAQVARGYLSNPALTESRFVQRNGQRLYKSGDMVRMLSDGNFEFVGRADDQVKIRGLRVELGEINNVLQESDSLIASVNTQILKKSQESKEQLVAFLALKHSVGEKTIVTLRKNANEAAMKSLPPYMVPQFFIFIDKIPLSRAGKVDKAVLTEVFHKSESSEPDANGGSVENYQWSETETAIRLILSKLSKTPAEKIFPKTTIHQLGLDSISAVQVAASLRRQGYSASATDVLRNPSCYSLAFALKGLSTSSTQDSAEYDFKPFEKTARSQILALHDVPSEAVEAIRPCTPLQKGMVSHFISKEGSVYFNHLKFQVDDDVDVAKLRVAWQQAMQRHPILRTGFVHLTDKVHPFAMIHYTSSFSSLPWEETQVEVDYAQDTSQWLQTEGKRAASSIHLPPWRIRHIQADGHNSFDLAIFHGLFDAQSLQTIFDDVIALYHDLPMTSPTPLDPVVGAILNLSSGEDVVQRKFWHQMGQGASPTRFPNMAPLRTEVAPPVVLSKLSSSSLADIESGCRQSSITLQAAGLASWSTILSAYTGEQSVTCGLVLSGRTVESAESAVFPCITTVPFVCKLEENKKAVLEQIMSVTAGLQRYQFLPLNEIQKEMGYPNEPLFDSIFVYQKIPNYGTKPKLWEIVDEKATVDFPISIELEPNGDQLEYRLTFLPHIVPSEQASLILDQLDHLLIEFVFQETLTLHGMTYTPDLYSITPPKEANLPSDATLLHHFVESSAERFPTRVAIEFATSVHNGFYASKWLSYEEFNAEGNRIASMLVSRHVKPGSLIGICFDKCIEASTSILGILKAGCAFVALDPGAPVARKAYILQDSGAVLILSMKAQSGDLWGSTDVPIVNIDELKLVSYSTNNPSLSRPISHQDRSYCLYTSGTTGNPKGCELTHENAVQAMLAFQRLFDGHWNETSRWLQFASFHFDVSVLEQFWSWSVGIRLVSAPRDVLFEDLANSIRVLGITHIDLTPSLARVLHPDDVPSLCRGVFITGGESLKQEILDVWGPQGVIYNGYGPTEATIGVTMYPRVPENGKPSNIGPQFDNVGSYVLRPNSDIPVLRGGMGELCVSGKLVGKGYLNRPELTKERFPLLERFNHRVYRTGDLVRILHNNTFEFLGRADDQVKLRGQRLEIGEINSVIKQSSSGISDVTTLVLKHPKQQKEQLVAFIVTGSRSCGDPEILLDQVPELSAAKELCLERLPGYMIPTHFVTLTVMPLSPNNKADARKLKQLYNGLSVADLQLISGLSSGRDEVWTRDEEKIRDVLTEVAGVDATEIRKSSSFFELGLDSVSAITFSQGLKQAGFKKAQVSLIMKHTSISRLARALSDSADNLDDNGSITAAQQSITAVQHRHRRAVADTLGVDPREIETIAPTTPLQQGMIARSLESERTLYFNAFRFKLAQNADKDKLRDAWEIMFKATQILRTCFSNTEDGFVQVALRNPALPWKSYSDLGSDMNTSMSRLTEEWRNKNSVVMKHPFELVLISNPTHQYLAVHIFHGLYDGESIALIFKTVSDIYHSRWDGSSGPSFQSALPYGPLRIRDGARVFWQKHLSGATYQPFSNASSERNQFAITTIRDIKGLSSYEATRRKLNVTPQAIAQACWATVLQSHFKGATTLGMIVSGRSLDFDGADRVIGPLFNTIPYHHRLEKGDKWSLIVKHCHEFNMAAHPYQHTPLRDIRKWCTLGPHQSLFDTLFVYQKDSQDSRISDMGDLWELMEDESDPDYPLAIEVEQGASDTLKLTLVSKAYLLDEKLSERLLDQFEELLRKILKSPDTVVGNIGTFEEVNDHIQTSDDEQDVALVNSVEGFAWTEKANTIREEVAALAETEVEEVNESTSIFELGLDSIDAIKLSSKLKKRGIELSVSSIMRALTITNMLQRISDNGKEKIHESSDMVFKSHKRRLHNYLHRKGLDRGDIERILPLTPLQEAMVAEMLSSEYKRYFNHDVLKIPQNTDMRRLQEAWNMVVQASPILRTSFIEVDDPNVDYSYAQVVHKTSNIQWQTIESKDVDFTALFESIRRDVVAAGFERPLFQIRHVQCDGHSYLVLSISHALYDGWSLGLLHDDVHRAYNGSFEPRPDYENALREILTASGSDAAAFWRDYLFDSKASLFPQRQHTQTARIAHVYRQELPSQYPLSKISSFAKKNNVTLQTLGQTVYALVLAFYVQSLDVVYGSVLSGRDNDAMHNILFPTMNTVAIRTILHGTKREMLRYVQDNFTAVKQWQHFPLRKAQGMACIRGALFDTLFIYQKRAVSQENDNEALYESVEGQSDVEYPVCVEMEVIGDELIWRCACKEEVFSEAETKEFITRLDSVLKDVIENADGQTISFGQAGTVIGGLPPFTDAPDSGYDEISDASFDESPTPNEHESSATANAIREVLAFVSKVPEEEIVEGMTIFHIGLDSISAIKVSSLLRKQSIVLSVGDMLRAGTVEKMAQVVDERKSATVHTLDDSDEVLRTVLANVDLHHISRRANVSADEIEQVLPTSAGQVYMLSAWLKSEGTVFFPEFRYSINSPIAFEDLRQSWEKLIAVHPVLRTILVATDNTLIPYVQLIRKTVDTSAFDTTDMDEDTKHQLIQKRLSSQPFLSLFAERAESGWSLKLKIHHALYDGVSLPEIMRQLEGFCNGKSLPSPRDVFTKLLAASTTEDAQRKRKEFWTSYLKGAQQSPLPQPLQTGDRRIETFQPSIIPSIRSLEQRSRQHGLSIQSLFLAAYAKLHATHLLDTSPNASNPQDIIIGIYLANRSHPIPSLITAVIPTVNLVPLRISAPLDNTLTDMAAQIQYDMQEISRLENASVALWEIDAWTGVKLDTFVNFLKFPDAGKNIGAGDDGCVRVRENGGLADGKFSRAVQMSAGIDESVLEKLRVDAVNGAYLHAIDIEATVRNGGLDVGVFGPESMIGLEKAELLVEEVGRVLGEWESE
jgi:amino acid adenylation domain-containing protein